MKVSVTFTGADDGVDPHMLAHLSRFYPFVEWAVLFSEKRRGSPRYPSLRWVRELEDLSRGDHRRLPLAMHLCGAEARAAVATATEFWPGDAWRRVQINGYEPGAATERWRRSHRFDATATFRWILQVRSPETLGAVWHDALAADTDILYDPSGGAGKGPTSWPEMPIKDGGDLIGRGLRSGFAGGIGPNNVDEVLHSVLAHNEQLYSIWIDMESGVRTDDKFDLDKVKAVIDVVARFR